MEWALRFDHCAELATTHARTAWVRCVLPNLLFIKKHFQTTEDSDKFCFSWQVLKKMFARILVLVISLAVLSNPTLSKPIEKPDAENNPLKVNECYYLLTQTHCMDMQLRSRTWVQS